MEEYEPYGPYFINLDKIWYLINSYPVNSVNMHVDYALFIYLKQWG